MNDVKKLPIKNRASLETGLHFVVRGVDGVLDSSLAVIEGEKRVAIRTGPNKSTSFPWLLGEALGTRLPTCGYGPCPERVFFFF